MSNLIRHNTYVNIKNHIWITKEQLCSPSYKSKFLYYWTGLVNNQIHKFRYLSLKAKLGILNKQIIAMTSDLYAMIQNEKTDFIVEDDIKTDEKPYFVIEDNINTLEDNINTLKNKIKELKNDIPEYKWINNIDDVVIHFKILDNILLQYHDLIWNTRAPMKEFINTYIKKRNRACYIEPRDIYTEHDVRSKLRMDDLSSMITEFEVMTDFVRLSVDTNDGMPFKLFLLFLNSLTIFGEFVWNRNNL